MNEADLGRIITKKSYKSGTVYMSDLGNRMWAVVVLDSDKNVLLSKNFPYTQDTETVVFVQCKTAFKYAKECLLQKKLELLEEF